ncbi:hypothetical protein KPH14_000907 [Odynerus spinipes]|uniref:Uncharacterized protein n=1 Tax=Odynerus spinipes TaxID=1348599 RepID=A0AAD9RD79_9HYME|nr:hypothetical protein KPH14_000907 [Odynerus spinipes]
MKIGLIYDDVTARPTNVEVTGIGLTVQKPLCLITLSLQVGKHTITHPCYLVWDDFPIEADGLLGIDFIETHDVAVTQRKHLSLYGKVIPLETMDTNVIAPRTEKIVVVRTPSKGEGLVEKREIEPGVYIADCLTKAEGGECVISIMNTTENEVELTGISVEVKDPAIPLKKQTAGEVRMKLNTLRSSGIERMRKLRDSIRTEHLNQEEKQAIWEICGKYNDLFYLEGDTLESTNTTEHCINVEPETAPINIAPYRLPQKQKEEVNRQVKEMLEAGIITKLRSITKKLNSIRATLGVEPRPKRGLINGLGTAGKYLFGLMDANDEERINIHLDKLERSETNIWHALSQQIQIVNSTIKIFNDSFRNIEQRERILATVVTRIEKMLNTQQRTHDLREQIDEQFMLITLMTDDLLEDVQDLTHYITDIRKGLINTNILSFAQILRYLQEALPHIPTGLNFPIPLNTQSGYLLDRVTEVKAYSRQRSISTVIMIPLIGTQIFQVKRVHPIPAHINNSTYAIIATSKRYAIVDEIRREYVSLSETDIQTCKATNTQFLCSSRHPIYKIYPHGPCEVRMHNQISKQPENCKTRLLTLDKTLLLELEAPETWIFVAPREEPLAVTCNG